MSNVPTAFAKFFDKIELNALAVERIESAWNRLRDHLVAAYGVDADRVFVQGSTANGTAVKPAKADGEIDLDIVVHAVDAYTSAEQAIADLREILGRDADLEARLEKDQPGRPCVRLRYQPDPDDGFGFHIDITPARTGQADAPLDVPMRGREDWKPTDPAGYTKWCFSEGEHFRHTVRMLKRWRDENDAEIKSIVLQVLVAHHLPDDDDDAARLTGALVGIRDHLAEHKTSAPEVLNPVLPSEDLAARWDDADYRAFRRTVGESARQAVNALQAADIATTHTLWRALLGEDFPKPPQGSSPPPPVAPTPRADADQGRTYG
jgi:hypothetical protein